MTMLIGSTLLITVYATVAFVLMIYGLNAYVMVALFARGRRRTRRRRRQARPEGENTLRPADLPVVTTQIAVYNEVNVVRRAMRAAAAMIYPKAKHEIQVLDDSTDETCRIVDAEAARLRARGHDVRVIRRRTRTGYKAGALSNGLSLARGSLVAVFDADFVPPPDYLLRTIPFFQNDARLGLVQTRWGHLNRCRSLLTRAQAIGIDGHFMVEQAARNWNRLFMNFNGTAGIWRSAAIAAGGGWQWDTLTEDMDLSYRVQLAGWQTLFLPDVVVPAEIPEDIGAFKNQQFRWAKGSIQTAVKLLPRVMRAPVPVFTKCQAVLHMTHYMVHPLMLTLSLLALPVLINVPIVLPPVFFAVLAAVLALSMLAPNALYAVSQKAAYRHWGRRIVFLPALVVIGVGLAVSNTRAVAEALLGRPSAFVRTPKRGDRTIKSYHMGRPWLALAEIGLGGYCAVSLSVYLSVGKYLVGPFLAIYTAGFLFVGLLSLVHYLTFHG